MQFDVLLQPTTSTFLVVRLADAHTQNGNIGAYENEARGNFIFPGREKAR